MAKAFSSLGLLFLLASGLAGAGSDLENGVRLAMDGKYSEAARIFEGLLFVQPKDARLNYYAGLCYLRMKKTDHALFYLEKAVEYEADFPKAYLWLTTTYLKKQRSEQARQTVNRGLELFPNNARLIQLSRDLAP